MASIPVVHELGTSFLSLGDVITGDPEKARERWKTYAEESVIGSCVAATVEAVKGNEEKSKEYLKGMGRATGKAVLGGGLLKDVPGFHELAVCGESLGDMIGGGDDESARERWKTYSENSVIGSGLGALAAKIDGDDEKAERLTQACGKAGKRFGVTAATVTAVVASGGLAAAHGVAAAAGGVIVGGAAGVGSTAAIQMIDNDEIHDPGAVVGMGLMVAVSGHMPEAENSATVQKASALSSEDTRNGSQEATKTTTSPDDTPNFHEETSTSSDESEKNSKKTSKSTQETRNGFEEVAKATKCGEGTSNLSEETALTSFDETQKTFQKTSGGADGTIKESEEEPKKSTSSEDTSEFCEEVSISFDNNSESSQKTSESSDESTKKSEVENTKTPTNNEDTSKFPEETSEIEASENS